MSAPRTIILGTAGHIDHGKTSLVRALTGVDTDRLPEEKQRGITIDIGFAHLDLGDARLGIVDVPGHERFIKNMLAGATGIDLAMLVIAADDAIMPQTREHLAILRLLGVNRGVIAITKCDLAEPSWLDLVEAEIRSLVRGSFLEHARLVRTSAATGMGLDELKHALREAYESLDAARTDRPFRLAIDRSFAGKGVGTVVTGTVYAGTLRLGDEVEWLPRGQRVRVRGLQSHGRDVESVSRGQRAAINLIGVHHTDITRGHELAAPGSLAPSRVLTVHLSLLPECPWPLKDRARVRLHLGTAEVMARVRLLSPSPGAPPSAPRGAPEPRSTALPPGGEGYAQLVLAQPVVASGGQPFVIRAESPLVTLGGGHVLLPVCRRWRGRETRALLPRLAELRSPDARIRAEAAIRFFAARSWIDLDLARDADVSPAEAATLIDALRRGDRLVTVTTTSGGAYRLHADVAQALTTAALDAVRTMQEASPLETFIPRPRLIQHLKREADADTLHALLDHLVAHGVLAGDERGVWTPRARPVLSPAQQVALTKAIALCQQAGLAPTEVNEVARAAGLSDKDARRILDVGVSTGDLVHVGGPLYMHAMHERALRQRVIEALAARPDGMTMGELREVIGVSRRHAVPLAEHLDRIGVTKRVGDVRRATQEALRERSTA